MPTKGVGRQEIAEIIKCLLLGPKTIDDVVLWTGISRITVSHWLRAYESVGLVVRQPTRPAVWVWLDGRSRSSRALPLD